MGFPGPIQTSSTSLKTAELASARRALLQERVRRRFHSRTWAPITRHPSQEAPLSFAQERLWFLEQLQPGCPLYNLPQAVRLTGPLDVPQLQQCLNEIVRRHESLRTNFRICGEHLMQSISPVEVVPMRVVDLQNVPDHARTEALQRHLSREAQRPFDLQQDPLLRMVLFRLACTDHVLLLAMHHIVADAWSIGLLLEEMVRLYSTLSKGLSPSLPELPIQYSDFARWQRESMQSERFAEDMAFWKQQLADAPALDLPTDRPRAATLMTRGATRSRLLPPALSSALARLGREENATLFMTLLAPFQLLLCRYTRQEDISVGTPIACRSRSETERLIGLFLNTLVLRTDCARNPTFRELLRRVRDVCLGAYTHQDVPFEKLVEELEPVRAVDRTPLFQVMFTLQNSPKPRLELEELRVQLLDFDLGVSPFDLTLYMEETDAGLLAAMEYKTDLFDPGTIDRMLSHFENLLQAAVKDPEQHISALPLLPPAERHQLLSAFNPSEPAPAPSQCWQESFQEQVVRTPKATAVVFGEQRLTYQELDRRSNQLTQHLRSLGIGPGALVGICLKRSLETIIGVLGILKAGAAYVPLDPDYPRERLEFILRDTQAPVVLTQESVLPQLPVSLGEAGGKAPLLLCLDRDWPLLGRMPTDPVSNLAAPADLFYVIYTSGSTGAPKGVLVEHQAVLNHCWSFASHFGITAGDRVLQSTPLTFDVSAEEIFPALLTGATLVLRPEELALDIPDFQALLVKERVTVLNLPTPYWSEWMSELEHQKAALPPALRLLIVGTEAVTVEQFTRWRKLAANKNVRWCNAYGTTESTITATVFEPESDDIPPTIPIGKPLANKPVYILDPFGHLAPIGVPGELCIGGDIARGYLHRPELSAQRFVPNPFSPDAKARLNRTGDLARWRPDGNIEFLGRLDDQVKIRGFRIELGEIEAALLNHPAVKKAVVVAREDRPGEKRLVAYYVPVQPAEQIAAELRQFLKDKLPAYMVPSAFVPMQALPLLSSGKLSRKALPPPAAALAEVQNSFSPPTDPLEQELAKLWAKVLDLPAVRVDESFFDLGGHSLLAVRLFREVEGLTGCKLPIISLFQAPTIRQLADVIRRQESSPKRLGLISIHPEGTKPPLFLVHGAGGGMLWGYANLARHLGPDQPVYCFNSRGLEGLPEFSHIEQIAKSYLEQLKAFQPEGPYLLGGYCFGGEIAFEMAQQLQAQGDQVELLALFNAMPPNSDFEKVRFTPRFAWAFAWNAWRWFRYFWEWKPEQRSRFVCRKLKRLCKLCRRFLGLPRTKVSQKEAEDSIDLSLYPEHQRQLWDVHLRASQVYHPAPYPGHITLFRTSIYPVWCSFDPAFGWGEIAQGGVTVKLVPGAHESILDEPHVRVLAGELKAAIAGQMRVEQQTQSSLSCANPSLFYSSLLLSWVSPYDLLPWLA